MIHHPSEADLSRPAADPSLWPLNPSCVFLNHGSFGSCPRRVLEFQRTTQDRMEAQPVQFFVRDLEGLLDSARQALAQFVGAPPEDLVCVPNATAGVNIVLRALRFKPGDELLVTDQEYNACRNALDFAAEQAQARVVVAKIPFPLQSEDQILNAVLDPVTPRTRLALLDHITSQTGLMLPIERLAKEFTDRGIDMLVDGAHAPGMVPLNLSQAGIAYYTGNCHKWICAPKGAAFLYVQPSRQRAIRPLSISHGANSPRTDRSRYPIEFGWTGTWDPSAFLAVPEALRFVGSLLPGGWPDVMARNRRLALAARKTLCQALSTELPCPDQMLGSLASICLPDADEMTAPTSPLYADPLQDQLREQFSIEVPIIPWPAPPQRVLRISAQLYNSLPQYQTLANALAVSMEKQPHAKDAKTAKALGKHVIQ